MSKFKPITVNTDREEYSYTTVKDGKVLPKGTKITGSYAGLFDEGRINGFGLKAAIDDLIRFEVMKDIGALVVEEGEVRQLYANQDLSEDRFTRTRIGVVKKSPQVKLAEALEAEVITQEQYDQAIAVLAMI